MRLRILQHCAKRLVPGVIAFLRVRIKPETRLGKGEFGRTLLDAPRDRHLLRNITIITEQVWQGEAGCAPALQIADIVEKFDQRDVLKLAR